MTKVGKNIEIISTISAELSQTHCCNVKRFKRFWYTGNRNEVSHHSKLQQFLDLNKHEMKCFVENCQIW